MRTQAMRRSGWVLCRGAVKVLSPRKNAVSYRRWTCRVDQTPSSAACSRTRSSRSAPATNPHGVACLQAGRCERAIRPQRASHFIVLLRASQIAWYLRIGDAPFFHALLVVRCHREEPAPWNAQRVFTWSWPIDRGQHNPANTTQSC